MRAHITPARRFLNSCSRFKIRKGIGILIGVLSALSGPLAAEQLSPDWAQCLNRDKSFSRDAIISGCSAVLLSSSESVANRVIAHINRGLTHQQKGEMDRAIADYSEAIRLDPRKASNYHLRGVAYDIKGEVERAIADYTETIRLEPDFADAYIDRGAAYKIKGGFERAIADYSEALGIDPRNDTAYHLRGDAYYFKGEIERAIADYTEAIGLEPGNAYTYANRGRAYIYGGSLASALADFKQASELDPEDAYAAIWLDLAQRRSKLPSRLRQAVAQLDMSNWPAPVVRLYLGELTVEQTLTAADHPDSKTRGVQVCEANFYAAEVLLLEARKDDAVRLLRLAVADCYRHSVEWRAAHEELRLLGAEP